jgi:hypothetical protein
MEGDRLQVGGMFFWEVWGSNGRPLRAGAFRNGILQAGINSLLDTFFRYGTAPAAFYLGIIDDSGYTALASDDTMASHSGWIEVTNYTAATRPAWGPEAAAAGLLTATAPCSFVMNASKTAKGLFVCTESTKGGSTGTLWAHGLFETEQVLQSTETLKCYYELLARSG